MKLQHLCTMSYQTWHETCSESLIRYTYGYTGNEPDQFTMSRRSSVRVCDGTPVSGYAAIWVKL